jgi:two-component system response regulator LytT
MKVAIFEDEVHNAERLTTLLRQCNGDIEVTAVIGSVSKGIQWVKENQGVDLLLMDIQLSDGNCFEFFKEANVKTPVIFTTAYDNFALQAFKVNSVDYLMKPIDVNELKNALVKHSQLRTVPAPTIDITRLAEEFTKRENTRFIGRINSQLIYVKAKDIAFLQFTKGITYVTTQSNQRMPLDYSLDQIEKMLDKSSFFRINRQFIINIDSIKKINTYYNNRLILQLQP